MGYMKVTFYRHSLLSRGGDRMVVEYANYLVQKGHTVVMYTNEISTVFEMSPLVEMKKIPFPSKAWTILYGIFKKFSADRVIVDIIPLSIFLSMRNRKRLLYFAQDWDVSYYKGFFMKMLVDLLYITVLRFQAIKAIAVSEQLTSLLKKRYGAKNVTTVTNGIDHSVFYPEIDDELIKARGERKAIFVFSRGDYRKGFDIALRVLNELSDRLREKAIVWVVGEEVKNSVLEIPLSNFGWVDEKDLRKILSSADLFLYPTRHEGLPLFPIEAMACGCPVVTTEAVPYAVDGENAVVCRVEDVEGIKEGVLKIFQDRDLRNKIREGGFRTAGKYDIAESRERFLEKVIEKNID